eukprot:1895621-Rhodomonas_salina.1
MLIGGTASTLSTRTSCGGLWLWLAFNPTMWQWLLNSTGTLHLRVKQGNVVSPILFSLAINLLLLQLAVKGGGYRHSSGELFNVLTFADDLILISDDPTKLQGL